MSRDIDNIKSFRGGDVTGKEYQARIINAFVREVYLWDDRIGIDYYYARDKSTPTYDIDGTDHSDIESPGEFIYTPLGGTKISRYPLRVSGYFAFVVEGLEQKN